MFFAAAISTHTPHARRDYGDYKSLERMEEFLLTRLMRGVTELLKVAEPDDLISTHTPHARRDRKIYNYFAIKPLHVGGPIFYFPFRQSFFPKTSFSFSIFKRTSLPT